ncbi:MAG: hypothetical protein HQL95_02310 [Magnetococcales bacterium]|nr:hypothetical protein [Magnetococcales bacterium]
MTASISVLQRAILAKRETTPYVYSGPVASDSLSTFTSMTLEIDPMRIDKNNLARRTFGISKPEFDPEGSFLNLKIDVPGYKTASPGAKPVISEFLWACGLKETVTAGVSVKYEPQTPPDVNAAQTTSFMVHQSGEGHKLAGARGAFSLSGSPKDGIVFKFDLSSPWMLVPQTIAIPVASPPPATKRLVFASGAVVMQDGSVIDIGQFDFSPGNKVEKDVSSGGGTIFITDTKPTLKINPYSVAGDGEFLRLLNSEAVAFQASFNNGAMVLDIPVAVRVKTGKKERAGRFSDEIEFECIETNGDDAFSLLFT